MPRLLHRQTGGAEWMAADVRPPGLVLESDGSAAPLVLGESDPDEPRLVGEEGSTADVLLCPQGRLLVNGRAVLSMSLLTDRDEIRFIGCLHRFYFLSHDPVEVVAFGGSPEPVFCPRCTSEIQAGSPAERCSCGIWYHQDCGRAYGPCPSCHAGDPGNQGDEWTPEDL